MENTKLVPLKSLSYDTKFVARSVYFTEDVKNRLDQCCNDNPAFKTKVIINTLLDTALKELGY